MSAWRGWGTGVHPGVAIGRAGAAVLALALACVAALPARAAAPQGGGASDTSTVKPPKARDISYFYDLFDQSFVRPATRAFDPALGARKLAGHLREAVNVDEQDQVRLPSTWWQPRVGFKPVTPQQLVDGPGPGTGPAPGPITITKAKVQGATPGFYIKDSNGDKFIVKFDPPSIPELTSAADVVSSVLFWGAGYNVPDDDVFFFRREDVKLGPKVELSLPHKKKRAMTEADIDDLLSHVAKTPDGRYRALTSRLLKGQPLGPFLYEGRRQDDPEDLIPHELRRELRGLWVVEAWLNNADARAANSLDMWVEDGGRSFVRHYLIDFNGCLGAGSVMEKTPPSGSEYDVDYGAMARSALTLGLTRFPWESMPTVPPPCIGNFDVRTFDAESWRPDYPNPAFDARTLRDIRWGARIVAAFDDEMIRAAVARARFSSPECGEALARILIGRRDKIVQRWLGGAPPPARTVAR